MTLRPGTLVRGSAVVRMVWGAVLASEAKPIVSAFGEQTRAAVVIARVLAGRHLLQGVVTFAVPSRGIVVAGAVVDVMHAATAVAAAVGSRRWRAVALTDAAVAAAFAGVGAGIAAAADVDRRPAGASSRGALTMGNSDAKRARGTPT